MFYYSTQTSVVKCFFRLASGTVGFSPWLKNSGHVITFLRRCGLQNTNHVMPFWPLKVDSLSHVFPSFVKAQRKERSPLYKILLTLAGVYPQWTTPRTCISRLLVRVHATATPVQAVHVRTERTIVNEPAKQRCVSPAPREFARNWDTRRLWLSTAFRFFL